MYTYTGSAKGLGEKLQEHIVLIKTNKKVLINVGPKTISLELRDVFVNKILTLQHMFNMPPVYLHIQTHTYLGTFFPSTSITGIFLISYIGLL